MTEMTEMTDNEQVEVAPIEEVIVFTGENPDPENAGFIKVDAKKNGKSASLYYNFGKNLDEMKALFGEEVAFSQARAQMKIKLQSGMRSYLAAGRDVGELATKFVPGVALERVPTDMGAASETYFTSLSDAEQDAMIARLMEAKAGN